MDASQRIVAPSSVSTNSRKVYSVSASVSASASGSEAPWTMRSIDFTGRQRAGRWGGGGERLCVELPAFFQGFEDELYRLVDANLHESSARRAFETQYLHVAIYS
jgi:hypothetical protein